MKASPAERSGDLFHVPAGREPRPGHSHLPMPRAAGRSFLLAALAFPLHGCAMLTANAPNPFETPAATDEIEILVRNLNFSQVTVYTARAGSGRRLGIVPGKGEATFKLRWTLPDIRLRLKPLAGREFFTETLTVAPGELLELIVPPR